MAVLVPLDLIYKGIMTPHVIDFKRNVFLSSIRPDLQRDYDMHNCESV